LSIFYDKIQFVRTAVLIFFLHRAKQIREERNIVRCIWYFGSAVAATHFPWNEYGFLRQERSPNTTSIAKTAPVKNVTEAPKADQGKPATRLAHVA